MNLASFRSFFSGKSSLIILALGLMSLSSCAFIKRHTVGEDDPDAAPKRKEPSYRDAVEQRVFYDGWFQR